MYRTHAAGCRKFDTHERADAVSRLSQSWFYQNIGVYAHKKWRTSAWASEYQYLHLLTSQALPTLGYSAFRVHSLGEARISVTDNGATRIQRSHVRIFVFGWDHVWIKWQHGSPADADISALDAAQHEYTRSVEQLATLALISRRTYEYLWVYLSTFSFITAPSRMRQRWLERSRDRSTK